MFTKRTHLAATCLALTLSVPARSGEPQPEQGPVVLSKISGSYLGVGVVELTPERVKALGLTEERGVEITRVEEGSPASKSGLRNGDVVLEYNGTRVEGVEQFMRLVRETPPGREVKLAISRNGGSQAVAVRTESRKSWAAAHSGENGIELPRIDLSEIRIPEMPKALMSWRSTFLGIEGEALDHQLAQFFGVSEGVLVRSVVKGSPADKAGLKAGDVIVKVDDVRVATPRDLTNAFRASRSRKSTTVLVVREKKEMNFTISAEEAASVRD